MPKARKEVKVRGRYAMFWGQWPSNWEDSPMEIDGVHYNCVEQWMMAEKARLFEDAATEAKIMAAESPADQKRHGRRVAGYDDARWATVRYAVVLRGTLEKYRQNPHLMKKLMATGDLELVEASPEDVVWGIGVSVDHPDAADPSKWRGQNLLGRAITEARRILRCPG
jgi:hypothetical protein